ncbi:hypothetical protein [Desertibaculum subflavum]|uniref:hypothetical protein n=1 Tax=Desertibaculum subflavum TaxID=2268458 RepID=UPI000E66F993
MHESVVVYNRFRFLKAATLLGLVAIVLYAWHDPAGGLPNGGTWLGYGLGTIGALLILWLMWFGVRKRSYGEGHVKLEAWLSAHIYLGLSLIVVATLHTGFQFGWNVHTLAYVLMMLVIASGAFGLYAYLRYPRLMTENRRGLTLTMMMQQIADADRDCRESSMQLGEEINRAVLQASQDTRLGGSMWRQLAGRDPNCATLAALRSIERLAEKTSGAEASALRRLVTLMTKKVDLLRQARRDIQLSALMQIWLYVHVPLTFALIAALVAHVIAVFFYW